MGLLATVAIGLIQVRSNKGSSPFYGTPGVCGQQGHRCNPLLNQMCCRGLQCTPGPDLKWATAICTGAPEIMQNCGKPGEVCNESRGQWCCGGLRCSTGSGRRWGECTSHREMSTTTTTRKTTITAPRRCEGEWYGCYPHGATALTGYPAYCCSGFYCKYSGYNNWGRCYKDKNCKGLGKSC